MKRLEDDQEEIQSLFDDWWEARLDMINECCFGKEARQLIKDLRDEALSRARLLHLTFDPDQIK